MAKKEKKTNALRLLDQVHITYIEHQFDIEHKILDDDINKDCANVYKTLVTVANNKTHFVFVIPLKETLDLKKAAKVAQVKKIEMLAQKELLGLTGYIHGGCSPVGMKKSFKTFFDQSILKHDVILCSAGAVGLLMEIKRDQLINYLNAEISDVISVN